MNPPPYCQFQAQISHTRYRAECNQLHQFDVFTPQTPWARTCTLSKILTQTFGVYQARNVFTGTSKGNASVHGAQSRGEAAQHPHHGLGSRPSSETSISVWISIKSHEKGHLRLVWGRQNMEKEDRFFYTYCVILIEHHVENDGCELDKTPKQDRSEALSRAQPMTCSLETKSTTDLL